LFPLSKPSFEFVVLIFLNWYSLMTEKGWMQVILYLSIPLLSCLSLSLILSEKIVWAWSIELSNLILDIFPLTSFSCWSQSLLVILCGLSSLLLFLWCSRCSSRRCLLLLFLLFAKYPSEYRVEWLRLHWVDTSSSLLSCHSVVRLLRYSHKESALRVGRLGLLSDQIEHI
jgi:hypothetical protein